MDGRKIHDLLEVDQGEISFGKINHCVDCRDWFLYLKKQWQTNAIRPKLKFILPG